jgi:mono/diheme cytochrome c family protein
MAALPLHAEKEAGAKRGLGLAQQVCSECHAVQAQQLQSPNSRAPTFLALATTPGDVNEGRFVYEASDASCLDLVHQRTACRSEPRT